LKHGDEENLKDQTSAYKAHSCAEAAAPGRELGENSGRTWATQFMEYHQGFSWKAAASNPMHPGERSVATEAGTTVPTIGSVPKEGELQCVVRRASIEDESRES
jgi:hypothetical protein